MSENQLRAGLGSQSTPPPILPVGRGGPLPLGFAQQRLWLLAQMEGVSRHIALRRRLSGDLDSGVLRRALNRLIARHEALRTTFVYADGQPVQRVAPEDIGFELDEHDLRGHADAEGELQRLIALESHAAFDLQAGPLARGRLVRLADREHVLLITLHQIVSDDWSMDVLKRELSALYGAYRDSRADPLPKLSIQYPDYAVWQRQRLSGKFIETQVDFWRRALAGAPPVLELPTDHRRPAQQDFAGAFVALDLGEPLTARLKALGQRHGTTLFTTLLAGWAALLARLSGQRDLVIGAPVDYRLRAEVEPLIGAFVNNLALRLDLSGELSVGELLDRAKTRVLEARQHQDLRFEQLVEIEHPLRSLAHQPVFQVAFAWRNRDNTDLDLPGLSVSPIETPSRVVDFDLTLSLAEAGGRIVGELEYATALFDRATVERYTGYLRRLLEEMTADDRLAVDRLPLLGDDERHRLLVEWNATEAAYPQDTCVHELFEAQAARTPNTIALAYEGERLTYAELNAKANRLAHHLRTLGVRPDERVAICVERSPEMVVGLLAILKAGGAYLPLDPAYPAERLAYMLEDSSPAVVLSHGRAQAALDSAMAGLAERPPVLHLDGEAPAWADRPTANPDRAAVGLTPRHLAFVIYTSGSTGQPKGVMVEHASCTNRIAAQETITPLSEDAVFAQKTALGFVDSFFETLVPLAYGKLLEIIPVELAKDSRSLVSLISKLRISNLLTIPSLAATIDLEREDLSTLKHWVMSGEIINRSTAHDILSHLPGCRLSNVYGSTEVTADATYYEVSGAELGAIPIGRPLPNTRIYILDGHRQPAPIGVSGEIFVGGIGVARGYLNRPEMTTERFFTSPFVAGDRLFRTGDLGRYLADGNIEFLGRTDFQVKIRGFRIELGEIEAKLSQHPAVREAVVLAREDTLGDKRLAAYYTARTDVTTPGPAALREHVAASLPEYMVPAAYVRLKTLPLNANGKLDRKALPAPTSDAYATRPFAPAQGSTEETLARIFAAALNIERVGRDDDFFELGGDSLLSIGVMLEIEKALHQKLANGVLFSNPTIAGLAAHLTLGGDGPKLRSVVPLHTRESGGPIFMVHLIERELARHLGRQRPVYALSFGLAAIGSSDFDVHPPKSIESVAAHYVEELRAIQPRGPYRLLGHSLGGQIAFEVAQQLRQAGESIAFLGLVDSEPPDPTIRQRYLPLTRAVLNLMRTPPKQLRTLVNDRIDALPIVRRAKLQLLPTRASFHIRLLNLDAVPYWPKPYPGRIDLFKATIPEVFIRRESPPPFEIGWGKLALEGCEVHILPGGHMDIVKDPTAAASAQAILRVLNEIEHEESTTG